MLKDSIDEVQINYDQLKRQVEKAVVDNLFQDITNNRQYVTINLVGESGIGKSSIVKDIAYEIGIPFQLVNVSTAVTNPEDWNGLWEVVSASEVLSKYKMSKVTKTKNISFEKLKEDPKFLSKILTSSNFEDYHSVIDIKCSAIKRLISDNTLNVDKFGISDKLTEIYTADKISMDRMSMTPENLAKLILESKIKPSEISFNLDNVKITVDDLTYSDISNLSKDGLRINGERITVSRLPSFIAKFNNMARQYGGCLVLFDDYTRLVSRQLMNPTMPIIYQHQVGDIDLADGITFIMTTNPKKQEYIVQEFDKAFYDRLNSYKFSNNIESWLKWGKNYVNINKPIDDPEREKMSIDFYQTNVQRLKDAIANGRRKTTECIYLFCKHYEEMASQMSYRTLTEISNTIENNNMELTNNVDLEDISLKMMSKRVPKAVQSSFISFTRCVYKLPVTVDDVLDKMDEKTVETLKGLKGTGIEGQLQQVDVLNLLMDRIALRVTHKNFRSTSTQRENLKKFFMLNLLNEKACPVMSKIGSETSDPSLKYAFATDSDIYELLISSKKKLTQSVIIANKPEKKSKKS